MWRCPICGNTVPRRRRVSRPDVTRLVFGEVMPVLVCDKDADVATHILDRCTSNWLSRRPLWR